MLYAGGEAGQMYEVTLDGDVREVGTTEGSLLGLTLDGAGRVYACDCERCEVVRLDPRDGSTTAYSSAAMILPNASAFDDAGNLYVTDSGDTKEDNGRVLVGSGRAARLSVWCTDAPRYPNGICVAADGRAVLRRRVVPAGRHADPDPRRRLRRRAAETVALLPGTVPDGVALDASGAMIVACYRPDRVVRIEPGGEPRCWPRTGRASC